MSEDPEDRPGSKTRAQLDYREKDSDNSNANEVTWLSKHLSRNDKIRWDYDNVEALYAGRRSRRAFL